MKQRAIRSARMRQRRGPHRGRVELVGGVTERSSNSKLQSSREIPKSKHQPWQRSCKSPVSSAGERQNTNTKTGGRTQGGFKKHPGQERGRLCARELEPEGHANMADGAPRLNRPPGRASY